MAETILLLVPELFFQARIETAARRMGMKVLKAADWKGAIEVSKKTPPAGVVIDLGAPASAGPFKFLQKMKGDKALASMRTLGFLDHVRTDLAEKARKAGCSTVVSKNALSLDTDGYLRRLAGPVVVVVPHRPGKPPAAPAEEE